MYRRRLISDIRTRESGKGLSSEANGNEYDVGQYYVSVFYFSEQFLIYLNYFFFLLRKIYRDESKNIEKEFGIRLEAYSNTLQDCYNNYCLRHRPLCRERARYAYFERRKSHWIDNYNTFYGSGKNKYAIQMRREKNRARALVADPYMVQYGTSIVEKKIFYYYLFTIDLNRVSRGPE